MRVLAVVFCFALFIFKSVAQPCQVKQIPFSSGEKITYEVYYNWGFIWVSAGWVYFRANQDYYNGMATYHFYSNGKSYPKWNWFYQVDDTYQSYVHPDNLMPLHFSRDVNENKEIQHERYDFLPANQIKVSAQENDQPAQEKTISYKESCVLDPMTMIYQARAIPFENYKSGDKIPLNMVIDGEIYKTFIRYKGEEQIDVKGQGEFQALKFSALLVEGTIFKGGEDMTVWVTNDKNRVPLMIESEILVGAINVQVSKMENLKYPLSSKIEE